VGAGAIALAIVVAIGAAACGNGDSKSTSTTKSPSAAQSPSTSMREEAITVESAWARNSPAGGMMTPAAGMTTPASGGMMTPAAAGARGAAYMVIKNGGTTADALIGATSDIAATVEVHETKMDGDNVTMMPIARIEVPAGGSVELTPGGYHVMFIGLKQPLKVGEKVILNLQFEKAGTIPVQAEVREQ
jgi:copper(I)-binding protein